jgi:hypothetical protein
MTLFTLARSCGPFRLTPASNKFVIALAARFGITVSGTADEIMGEISSADTVISMIK